MAHQKQGEPEFVPVENSQEINLEHILPKNPEENWSTFDGEEAADSVNRLGNQALLRALSNSDLKSAAFDEKKKVYAKSSYTLTNMIAEFDEWTVQTIADRQKVLGELAVKTWPAK
jgi:hypothetical protein